MSALLMLHPLVQFLDRIQSTGALVNQKCAWYVLLECLCDQVQANALTDGTSASAHSTLLLNHFVQV
jgi:hypothetical protein